MKIAFVAKEYPPHGNPRTATYLFYPKLAKGLQEYGHEIHVITQSIDGSKREYMNDDGIYIHEVGPAPRIGNPLIRMLFVFNATLEARRLWRQHKVEIINVSVFGGEAFFCALFGLSPLVAQIFHFGEIMVDMKTYKSSLEGAYWRISILTETFVLRKAQRIIANSWESYRFLLARKGIAKDKISVIPEARIDLTRFKNVDSIMRRQLRINEEIPVVLYVGYLKPAKGLYQLCQAIPLVVQKFPCTVFFLKGEDTHTGSKGTSFKQYILDFAQKHDIAGNIRMFHEFLPEEDMAELYSCCDVFVFPSLIETFGWPVVEAMACERPVVATTTGIATQLKSKGLILVCPGDVMALANSLIYFLSMSRQERAELGKANREALGNIFSFQEMVRSYLRVYERLITGSKEES